MKLIGIVGCGQMGKGIAEVCLLANYKLVLYDSFANVAEKAIQSISEKYKHKSSLVNVISNVQIAASINDFSDCDLIIEAVKEDYEIKQDLFRNLSKINQYAILATNTSSLSVQRISQTVSSLSRFIGLHFMNPPLVMPLVEVVPINSTSSETINQIIDFCKSINKTVIKSQDQPGFIVNRILLPMINQAIYALEQGLSSAEDIDTAMKLGANFPMGPLALADFIGLDTCLAILQNLYNDGKNLTFPPSELLYKKVKEGKLGRKTKHGFFVH